VDRDEDRPSWNIPPSASSLVARADQEGVYLDRLTWGFPSPVPGGPPLVSNARVESAATKTLFRESWQSRRSITPVEGWYEWKRQDGAAKQPFFFHLQGGGPMYLAGLWQGDRFVVLTSETSGRLREVHHRRPVALDLAAARRWLSPDDSPATAGDLEREQIPESVLVATPVSAKVNSTRHDGPDLIEPCAPAAVQGTLL